MVRKYRTMIRIIMKAGFSVVDIVGWSFIARGSLNLINTDYC